MALNKKRIVLQTCDLQAYRVAISMIAPPLTPHLFLPKITIITNNDWDIALRFRQAVTNAVGHGRDCYAQFGYSCKQPYNIVKIFKLNLGPKELKANLMRVTRTKFLAVVQVFDAIFVKVCILLVTMLTAGVPQPELSCLCMFRAQWESSLHMEYYPTK